ncbi:MAG: magnesium transporter [Acholeplasmatales bacterium]|jgi:magnesium transporter|nr:magnesium transporter [Acholeplasmatales bacterium]
MIKELINNEIELKNYLEENHAYDIVEELKNLSEEEKEIVVNLLSENKKIEVLSYMDEIDAASIILDLPIEEQIEILENLEPDDAVDIILEFDDENKDELLEHLDVNSSIQHLMTYSEDETGSIVNTNILTVFDNQDVKLATKYVIDNAPSVENISIIYVINEENKFLGIINLRDLLLSKSPDLVSTIVEEYPFVFDDDSISASAKAIENYSVTEIAVVNKEMNLIGTLTIDDALDAYKEEAIEDYQKLSLLPEEGKNKSIFSRAMHRLPWLVILMFLSIPISLVTSNFEAILSSVSILMIFSPLILDASGDVATQTLAVTLKMISSDEKGILKNSFKEILTGMLNGLIMGLIAFIATIILSTLNTSLTNINEWYMALVVGLSLWITVLSGPVIGFSVPLFLKFLKIDPAVASGPFITTLIDIIALFLYLGLATLMLGGI